VLLSSLLNLSVSHFEISQSPSSSQDAVQGDPRSVAIRFEFAKNEYFEDTVLEKKFWHRRSRDGWSGLVSEPVRISWKKDRDLTGGLLDLVMAAWEVDSRNKSSNGKKVVKKGLSLEQLALKKKIDNTGMGGLSFFAWFGFIGRPISSEESAAAMALEREKRKQRSAEKSSPENPGSEEGDDGEESECEEEDLGMDLEIFPDGGDLAMAFTQDLWPDAIKYFSEFPFPLSFT
jgi:hypothetical protein